MNKIREVAERCHVAPDTVRKWVQRGLIKSVRLPGGSIRITDEELRRLLAAEAGNS